MNRANILLIVVLKMFFEIEFFQLSWFYLFEHHGSERAVISVLLFVTSIAYLTIKWTLIFFQ